MKISVIINNFNYAAYISECIGSVGSQTRAADEIIIVNDGSTDNSVKIIKTTNHPLRLISQPNQGQLAAIKTGIEAATGDIICFLDSDDTWNPTHLMNIERAFKSDQAPDYVYTAMQEFGKKNGIVYATTPVEDVFLPKTQQLMLVKPIWIGSPTSGNAIKSTFARKLFSGFTPDFIKKCKICADEVLVYGSSLIGCSKLGLAEATANYRIHGSNLFSGEAAQAELRSTDSGRRYGVVKEISRKENIQPDIEKLASEYFDLLERFPRDHRFFKYYLKAPRKLRLPIQQRLQLYLKLRSITNNT